LQEDTFGSHEDKKEEKFNLNRQLNLSSLNSSPSSQISSPHRVATKGAATSTSLQSSTQSSPKIVKVNLQRAVPLNGSGLVVNNSGNNSSVNSSLNPSINPSLNPSLTSSINPSINPSLTPSLNSSLNPSSSPSSNPSILKQRLPVHLKTSRQHSTGTLLMMMNNKNVNEKDEISSQNKSEPYSGSTEPHLNYLRRASASANVEEGKIFNGKKLEENRRPLVQRQQPQQKYIPPRRTAEELLLDKLEVNWSVPQIRKQFQQRETANEPAPVIDTLYVKFPGGPQQRQINKKQQLA
uniref:Uncharacterized protein n=1 Tax=Meloidogyne floridensis TaxID=298350 RepID=A0A915P6B5_9BILA